MSIKGRPYTWLRASLQDLAAALGAPQAVGGARPGRKPPQIRRGPPEPADVLRDYYREARRRSGVSATLLAAVNLVESDF